jgi:hypothetical protein
MLSRLVFCFICFNFELTNDQFFTLLPRYFRQELAGGLPIDFPP